MAGHVEGKTQRGLKAANVGQPSAGQVKRRTVINRSADDR
jgi:hypothetical protein